MTDAPAWRVPETLHEYAQTLARTETSYEHGFTEVATEVVSLVERGLTPAEVLDYWAIEIAGFDKKDWQAIRGVSGPQTINNHLRMAEYKLDRAK